MNYYYDNIEKATLDNDNYRKVIFTGKHIQLVLMTLKPNVEIGLEMHNDLDQFIRVESGNGLFIINNDSKKLQDGDAIVIPAGLEHNIKNTGDSDLKLYTIYTKPQHQIEKIQKSKPQFDEHSKIPHKNSIRYILTKNN
jgi:mannose-6-phosphate isomerase-like protein (cupin superfamily)